MLKPLNTNDAFCGPSRLRSVSDGMQNRRAPIITNSPFESSQLRTVFSGLYLNRYVSLTLMIHIDQERFELSLCHEHVPAKTCINCQPRVKRSCLICFDFCNNFLLKQKYLLNNYATIPNHTDSNLKLAVDKFPIPNPIHKGNNIFNTITY